MPLPYTSTHDTICMRFADPPRTFICSFLFNVVYNYIYLFKFNIYLFFWCTLSFFCSQNSLFFSCLFFLLRLPPPQFFQLLFYLFICFFTFLWFRFALGVFFSPPPRVSGRFFRRHCLESSGTSVLFIYIFFARPSIKPTGGCTDHFLKFPFFFPPFALSNVCNCVYVCVF